MLGFEFDAMTIFVEIQMKYIYLRTGNSGLDLLFDGNPQERVLKWSSLISRDKYEHMQSGLGFCWLLRYVVSAYVFSSNVNTRILKTHFEKSRQAGFFRSEFLKF